MVSTDSNAVHRLLDEARSMRRDTGSLVGRLGAESSAREVELAAASSTLDRLIREGSDPAVLGAFLDKLRGLRTEAESRDAAIAHVVKAFGALYDQLRAVHDALPDEAIERTLLAGEMSLCTGVMAALGEQWHRCTMELGIAAALADGPARLVLPPRAERRSASGLIILP